MEKYHILKNGVVQLNEMSCITRPWVALFDGVIPIPSETPGCHVTACVDIHTITVDDEISLVFISVSLYTCHLKL